MPTLLLPPMKVVEYAPLDDADVLSDVPDALIESGVHELLAMRVHHDPPPRHPTRCLAWG
jgi:hypothetical protein